MKLFVLSLFAVIFVSNFLAGCATAPKETKSTEVTTPTGAQEEKSTTIDYNALQSYLQLDRAPEELGFAEKAFNTCEAGFGYSRSQNCHKEYFVVIHFRLLCRDSEGTVSTILTDSDVTAIAGRPVRWELKGVKGNLVTDGEGYGQIRTVSSKSQNRQRLRVGVGNEFLYMRTNEITKVITPRPWCTQ
ncbi:MAG TPA: hypothetical protein VN132_03285 [Bdellovibrio sp.]|nr:hypothetical protein [Bdellovibrio sp.]